MRKYIKIISIIVLCLSFFTTASTVNANQSYHWGYKKSVNGQLPSIDQEGYKGIVEKYGALFLGDTREKALYLTFDNGYENGFTAQILDVLKAKKVPATFFITGHYATDQPKLLQRMVNEGHIIGNHSYSHPDMTRISDEKIKEELVKVEAAVAERTNQKKMTYLRPPRGIFNERTLAVSRQMGYTNVFWSLAYKDWDTKQQKGAQYAHQQVMKQLHPGAIILLHSVSKDNAEALASIIEDARKQGYEFHSLDQLMLPNISP